MPKQLKKPIYEQIVLLTDNGNALAQQHDFEGAWKKFWAALDLVPEPKMDWEATTWILASIGDVLFLKGEFSKAKDALADAVRCPGGLGNAFIHLRLGEVFFELGDKSRAADELTRAYMAGGREVFANEDAKYFRLLENVLEPPTGHSTLP